MKKIIALGICLILYRASYSQELIHVKGQGFGEFSYKRSFDYPGFAFSLGGGAFLSAKDSWSTGLVLSDLLLLESGRIWEINPAGDSTLFSHELILPYKKVELRGLYERKLFSAEDHLILNGLIGAAVGLESYREKGNWKPIYGPLFGLDTQIFLTPQIALTFRYLFSYQNKAEKQLKSQLEIGLRLCTSL